MIEVQIGRGATPAQSTRRVFAGLITKLFGGRRFHNIRTDRSQIDKAQRQLDSQEENLRRASYGITVDALEKLRVLTPEDSLGTKRKWAMSVTETARGTTYAITHPDKHAVDLLNYGKQVSVKAPRDSKVLRFFVGNQEMKSESNAAGVPGKGFVDRVRSEVTMKIRSLSPAKGTV